MNEISLPYTIFAVDPATTISGWSVLSLESISPLSIKIIAHGQLDGQKLLRNKKDMSLYFQRQFCVLDALEEEYTRLINLYKPDVIVSEGSFGQKFMAALIALTLAINVLRRLSYKLLNKDLVEIPPTISKMAFTGSGGADKDKMRVAYHSLPYLIRIASEEDITEHQIDACAHGVGFIKRDITKDIIQLSAKERRHRKLEKQKKKLLIERGV